MNTIVLHGELAERYAPEFEIDVRNPQEAYRAMEVQLAGFRDVIRSGSWYVIREMRNGEFALTEDMLMLGMSNTRLHFIPAIEGSEGKGGVKAILGVAMIGLAFVPGLQGVALAGLKLSSFALLTGISLVFAGISMILTPTPALNTGQGDNDKSFLIGGDFNPSGQNFAIPVAYGEWRIIGIPVATEIVTNEVGSGYFQDGSYDNGYDGLGGYNGVGFENQVRNF